MIKSLFYVAIGGSIGASLRFLINHMVIQVLPSSFSKNFPYGILTVNLIGSFLIGLCYVFFIERGNVSDDIKLFFITGILGAFTTFSTFSLDTLLFIQQGSIMKAFINIFFNVTFCLMATWLGIILAKNF